jgi:hypothetical protein
MKYLDYTCAWTMFLTALVLIVIIGFWHPSGMYLDEPLLWIPVAMMNFLRLRNGYSNVRGLRTFCIASNLIAFMLVALGFGLFASRMLKNWDSYYLVQALPRWAPCFLVASCSLVETIFSLQKNDHEESANA